MQFPHDCVVQRLFVCVDHAVLADQQQVIEPPCLGEAADQTDQPHGCALKRLVTDLRQHSSEIVGVITEMIKGINGQKEGTDNAAKQFDAIRSSTVSVQQSITQLADTVKQLKDSNQNIVDAVQTMSAISEEVSAHAGETMKAEEDNQVTMNEISEILNGLVDLTKEGK